MQLTETIIQDALPKDGKENILWDDELPGLGLRVAPSGRKTFLLKYRTADGQQRKPTLGVTEFMSLEQARHIARRIKAEVAREKAVSGAHKAAKHKGPTHTTVASVCDRYLREHAAPSKAPSSLRNDTQLILQHIEPRLGPLPIADVSYEHLATLHRSMSDTPYAANRTIALLSKLLTLSEEWGVRPRNSNPCSRITRYSEHQRERVLSELELHRLAKALEQAELPDLPGLSENPRIVGVIRLILFTGLRPSEAMNLKWLDVDATEGTLWIADSHARERTVPLSSAAREVIAGQSRIADNPYVFPGRRKRRPLKDIRRPWHRIRARARLDDVRLLDLRRTFAATAADGNITLYQISRLLGFSSKRSASRYRDLLHHPQQTIVDNVVNLLTFKKKRTD